MKSKLFVILTVAMISACGGAANKSTANKANANTATPQAPINLSVANRPQKIAEMMAARGEMDQAAPTVKIVEPRADASVASSTVKVKLELSGDLKGYKPHMDMETKMGNHVHVILDNQPYEAYYNLEQEFELRNVMDGEHILRVFPSRPWHEAYKNEGAFQMVKFKVTKGGADPAKPTTANGQTMSNANTAPTPEGKDMKPSNSGPVDPKKPLLTYSRPKGEYKSADAGAMMIDFWLTNAKLKDDGGEFRVRYSVDNSEAKFIDKWEPIWLSGLDIGMHTIRLDLVDLAGNVVDNGGYNSTTREITIVK